MNLHLFCYTSFDDIDVLYTSFFTNSGLRNEQPFRGPGLDIHVGYHACLKCISRILYRDFNRISFQILIHDRVDRRNLGVNSLIDGRNAYCHGGTDFNLHHFRLGQIYFHQNRIGISNRDNRRLRTDNLSNIAVDSRKRAGHWSLNGSVIQLAASCLKSGAQLFNIGLSHINTGPFTG
ncbi:hypothetical protein DJ90_6215 [Paenibacillus macerans]|uniref:Uncharacterized protein n=1 Tax=Paenibacillus macerans TaxID=44252 RepID=A0A090XT77_PAEMA|nr:hypothetical protein DJ90_6215 [Paenibacillus macerans]